MMTGYARDGKAHVPLSAATGASLVASCSISRAGVSASSLFIHTHSYSDGHQRCLVSCQSTQNAETNSTLTVKKQRITASFASVVRLIFSSQRELWRWFGVKSVMTLVCVSKATHRALQTWFDVVVKDISLGKEPLPVPVQLPSPDLQTIVQLMTFTYTTTVQLPTASDQYKLPLDLVAKHQNDDPIQRVLHGRQVQVAMTQCSGKGWGVLAAQQIEKRAFVGEYTDELISSREMRRRYRERYDPNAMNYVLSLREHLARKGNSELHFDVVRTNVDASSSGNFTRFFNHSCAPNLEVAAVRVDSFVPRLALFARRRIETGEELTFDYGEGASEQEEGHKCCCGALQCRGYLPNGR